MAPGRVMRDAQQAWRHQADVPLARLVSDQVDSPEVLTFVSGEGIIEVFIDHHIGTLRIRYPGSSGVTALERVGSPLSYLTRVGDELSYDGPLPSGIVRLRFGRSENAWTTCPDWTTCTDWFRI